LVKRTERQPEAGLAAAGTPCILAVNDVHLFASLAVAGAITAFYTELIALDPLPNESTDCRLAFYGYPRSGPRLFVDLLEHPPVPPQKRQLAVQVASLFELEQLLIDRAIPCEWSRGWSYYDRRLFVQDPAENRVELVAHHFL
jgi:hypothetical protein